jgi:predicted HAD superfamily Cof-like phosphohydrolase
MKLSEQVREFHRAMGQPVLERPKVPDDERVRLRLRLIAEEFMELVDATLILPYAQFARQLRGIIDTAPIAVDLVDMTDALADLDYVIEGTRAEFGIDGEPIAALVHDSNMAKLGGKPDALGKIQKPAGWQPPDIEGELTRQGWLE